MQSDKFQIGTFKNLDKLTPTEFEGKLHALRTRLVNCESIKNSSKQTKFEGRKTIPISIVLELARGGDNFALSHVARVFFYDEAFKENTAVFKEIIHALAYQSPSGISAIDAFYFGKMLLFEENIQGALECFKQLEKYNFHPAIAVLGRIHYACPLVKKDESKAREKWAKASELGHFPASIWRAKLLLRQNKLYWYPFGILNYLKVILQGSLRQAKATDGEAYVNMLI